MNHDYLGIVVLHTIKLLKGVNIMKKRNILTLVAALATAFATTIASSACYYFYYQPEEPKCLSDK